MKIFFLISAWLLSVLYLAFGVTSLLESPLTALLLIFTGIVICPYVRSKVEKPRQWRRVFEHRKKALFTPDDEFVYLISNDTFERGIFKIGMTTQSPKERVSQINSATGVPQPFLIDMLIATSAAQKLEQHLHSYFSANRVSNNREFFRLSLKEIIWLINNHNTVYVNYKHLHKKHQLNILK